jgi:hypothetical protein
MSRVVMVAALCLLAAACADDINRSEGPKRQRDRNPPSIGWIDIPANDATVDPTVRVSGWACDKQGRQGGAHLFRRRADGERPSGDARPDV